MSLLGKTFKLGGNFFGRIGQGTCVNFLPEKGLAHQICVISFCYTLSCLDPALRISGLAHALGDF